MVFPPACSLRRVAVSRIYGAGKSSALCTNEDELMRGADRRRRRRRALGRDLHAAPERFHGSRGHARQGTRDARSPPRAAGREHGLRAECDGVPLGSCRIAKVCSRRVNASWSSSTAASRSPRTSIVPPSTHAMRHAGTRTRWRSAALRGRHPARHSRAEQPAARLRAGRVGTGDRLLVDERKQFCRKGPHCGRRSESGSSSSSGTRDSEPDDRRTIAAETPRGRRMPRQHLRAAARARSSETAHAAAALAGARRAGRKGAGWRR
jgi:hypothetical protein